LPFLVEQTLELHFPGFSHEFYFLYFLLHLNVFLFAFCNVLLVVLLVLPDHM
jgi:hypothetical protein